MARTDKDMGWKRHKLFIPASQWQNGDNAAGIILARYDATHQYNGVVWGTSNGGTVGHASAAAVQGSMPVPSWWDPQHPLGFRVHFTQYGITSAAATITPLMLLQFVNRNATIVTTASGALDTIIGAQTYPNTTAAQFLRSSRGVKNGLWRSRAQITDGCYMCWSMAVTASTSLTTNAVHVLGLEVDYVPMMTIYPHSELDRPEDDTIS